MGNGSASGEGVEPARPMSECTAQSYGVSRVVAPSVGATSWSPRAAIGWTDDVQSDIVK